MVSQTGLYPSLCVYLSLSFPTPPSVGCILCSTCSAAHSQTEQQWSAALIRWRNYTRKNILNHGLSSEPCYVSFMLSSSNDFWYWTSWLKICSCTEEQQNHITWLAITSAVFAFTILKVTGIQKHCQHHPDHLWTHKPINCVFWRSHCIFWGSPRKVNVLVWIKQAGRHSRSASRERERCHQRKGITYHPFLSRHYGPGCDVARPFSA